MGNCTSRESIPMATAKLVMMDGSLREFIYPVKASSLVENDHPTFFICDSDEMELDQVISPMSADKELMPGNLYFALPLDRLRRRLRGEEMAALAWKACSALKMSGGGDEKSGCGLKHLVFSVVGMGSKVATGDKWWRFSPEGKEAWV